MFDTIKLYLYGALGLLITGLYAAFKYKSARLDSVSEKLEVAKKTIKTKKFEAKMKDNKSKAQEPPDYKVEPGKYSLAILPLLFIFVGCSNKEPKVYPRLETVNTVKPINFEVNEKGCVCGDGLDNVFSGILKLRKSEAFYELEINEYNKEYIK